MVAEAVGVRELDTTDVSRPTNVVPVEFTALGFAHHGHDTRCVSRRQFIALCVEPDGKIGESLGSRKLRALFLGDGISATESFAAALQRRFALFVFARHGLFPFRVHAR
jgi:hypothetical protein